MHDPMVVAHDLVLPIPVRVKWKDHDFYTKGRRWALIVSRRTNDENLGERVYRWWRPKGYTLVLAGRTFGLYRFGTIWHNEPRGRDSGEVCKHWTPIEDASWWQRRRARPGDKSVANRAWRWHVHHWTLQVFALQHLRRFMLDRCDECGRHYPYGYAPIGYSWDPPRLHFWQRRTGTCHHECDAMRSWKSSSGLADEAIQVAVAAYRTLADCGELEAIERLASGAEVPGDGRWRVGHRMRTACGWEYDSDGDGYVKTAEVQARREAERAARSR